MKSDVDIDVKWFGKSASQNVLKAAMKGLKMGGLVVAGEAMTVTPELSGTLKRSICVTEGDLPSPEAIYEEAKSRLNNKKPITFENPLSNNLEVYVSANTPYAHKQHEENKGKAKFLEKGLQAAQSKIPELIERELKKL